MKDPEKIDFSPLDPSKDELRWQRLIVATASRARGSRRAPTVIDQLVAWGRPALAFAAALCVVLWSGSWWAQTRTAERKRAAVQSEQAERLLRWALDDEVPPPEVVLQVVGDAHDR